MSSVNIVWDAVSESFGDRFKPEARKETPTAQFSALVAANMPLSQNFNPRYLSETVNLDQAGIGKSADSVTYTAPQVKAMAQTYQENVAAFDAELGKVFRANNISTNPPPALKITANGHVSVVGPHPDAQKIETLFESDAALRNQLTGLGHDAAKLRGAELSSLGVHPLGPLAQVAFDGDRIKQDIERRAAGRYASPSADKPAARVDHKA